jgi:YggT family protein
LEFADYALYGIWKVVDWVLKIYSLVIIVRALLTWVSPDPYNPLVRFISRLVDPVSYRISRIIPTRIGMVDISPIILLVLIQVIRELLRRILF